MYSVLLTFVPPIAEARTIKNVVFNFCMLFQEVPDMVTEACHLASKQLEELMDDDCHNPVLATNGRDPMLSSPHLGSPHDVMSSPASSHSGHYSNHSHDDLSDTMDLAVTA